MTTTPRTSGQRVRRAMIADAAEGLRSLSLSWLADTGRTDAALAAWARGVLAEVPVGLAWDVLRVPYEHGPELVLELRTAKVPLGPVLSGPSGVEFLVERETSKAWAPSGTELLPQESLLLCPHPSMTDPWSCNRRCWLVTPTEALTRVADLCAAYEAATALASARKVVGP